MRENFASEATNHKKKQDSKKNKKKNKQKANGRRVKK